MEPGLMGPPRCAVVGHPAGHSLSPALHRAAYRELGLDWGYDAVDLAPEQFDAWVGSLDESWRGLSVTMPHKVAVRAFGTGDELVQLTGVANTLVRPVGGEPFVRNTDVSGYLLALASAGVHSADSATVVGNGATARSAVVALRQLGVERLLVLARRPERAAELKAFASGTLGMLCAVRELAPGQVLEADVLVSTVPQGGADALAEELVAASGVIFDSVYDPWPTRLAQAARAAHRPVLSGLDLLAGQAVEQVALMTGTEGAPGVGFELLRQAGLDELARRGHGS